MFVNIADAPFNLPVNTSLENNFDGSLSYSFPALGGAADTIDYKVADINGSLSAAAGMVAIAIPAIVPALALDEFDNTSARVFWQVPLGFAADTYVVTRDQEPGMGEDPIPTLSTVLDADALTAVADTDAGVAIYHYLDTTLTRRSRNQEYFVF